MSEIVRPTRDGIHGREYISTSVDIGRKLPHLAFDDGGLKVDPPPLAEIPLPVIFDRDSPALETRGGDGRGRNGGGGDRHAGDPRRGEPPGERELRSRPRDPLRLRPPQSATANPAESATLVMIPDSPDVMAVQAALKREHPAQDRGHPRPRRTRRRRTRDGIGPGRGGCDPAGVRQPRQRAGSGPSPAICATCCGTSPHSGTERASATRSR